MSAKSNTLAKSLHTVSVLVSVARELRRLDSATTPNLPAMSAAGAVGAALHVLGYAGAADPYGLAAKAVAILARGGQS